MKRPENRDIDGKSYQIRLMGPKDQIKTMKFIANTIGRPIGELLSGEDVKIPSGEGGSKGGGLLDADSKVIGAFVKEALTSIDDDAIIVQIEKLLQFCERKNEKGNFASVTMEKDFYGELPHLFKLVAATLEVNFGDFLGVSTDLVARVKEKFQTKLG